MAGFNDIFGSFSGMGARLQQALQDPNVQLGLNLMAQGGFQPGNPSTGQRLLGAVQGMQQQQASQQQLQQQADLRKIQQQEILLRQKAMEDLQTRRQAVMDMAKNDPNFLAQSPMARQIAMTTGDLTGLADIAKIGVPVQPKPQQSIIKYNPNGTQQQGVYNYQTNQYDWGPEYRSTQQQTVDQGATRLQQGERGLDIQQQNANTNAQRATTQQGQLNLAQQKELRESNAAQIASRVKMVDLQAGYRGARRQLDEVNGLAQEIIKDPAFNSLFGPNGMIPTTPGTAAAGLEQKFKRLMQMGGLSEIVRLGQAGIHLTPVSDNDIKMVQGAFAQFDPKMPDAAAKEMLQGVINRTGNAIKDAEDTYNATLNAYGQPAQPAAAPTPPGAAPAPGAVAAPKSQADYDALPSGTLYVDPNTGRTARKR